MEKIVKYISQEGKEFDVVIKEGVVFISRDQMSGIFGIPIEMPELITLNEFIEIGNGIDRIKTVQFKIWANTQTGTNIEFGDAITKLSNSRKKNL